MSELRPLATFNFTVKIVLKGKWELEAGFQECDGLEMQVEPATVKQGGDHGRPILLPGKLSFGRVTLKRGMTEDTKLWDWFDEAQNAVVVDRKRLRADVTITVQSGDRQRSVAFKLANAMPVKVKAPALNALQGGVAIEELQIAHEGLSRG
jgi:phage tail-like protein